jgi:hypothetical protein
MPIFLCQMSFIARGLGWRELFYLNVASASLALSRIKSLALARVPCLVQGIRIGGVMVSNLGVQGDSLVSGIPSPPPEGYGNGFPWSGMLIALQSAPGAPGGERVARRSYIMRGLPYVPATDVRLTTYLTALVDLGFCLQCVDGTQVLHEVAAIVPDFDEGFVDVVVSDGWQAPVQDQQTGKAGRVAVRGGKWQGLQGARNPVGGVRTVIYAEPFAFVLAGDLPPDAEYLGGATAQLRTLAYVPIASAVAQKPCTRKTGRSRGYISSDGAVLPGIPGGDGMGGGPPTPLPAFPPGELANRLIASPPPAVLTITTALTLVSYEYDLYNRIEDIAVAPVVNYRDTWLVACNGTTGLFPATSTGILEDVHSAFDVQDAYYQTILQRIEEVVPPGHLLILCGDSLGGMECQNVVKPLMDKGYPVYAVITFGSPVTRRGEPGVIYQRFCAWNDPIPGTDPPSGSKNDGVVNASPLGLAYSLFGHPEQIHVPTDFPADLVSQHTGYDRIPGLLDYDAVGYPMEDGPQVQLLLGMAQYFPSGKEPPEIGN